MATEKLAALEHLFFTIGEWCPETKVLGRRVITSADVVTAIEFSNKHAGTNLSDKNAANFLKDIVRNGKASGNWPIRIGDLRFTARQVTGNKNVFVFLPFGVAQTEPFPDPYLPNENTPRIHIQSLTLPLEAKELGRTDEAWLLQTAINLRVVETHFATASKIKVLQIVHLQMSVKLAKTEIDALFYAKCMGSDKREFFAIITCEAKQAGERILDMQICEQVRAVFVQKKLILNGKQISHVIPIAMRVIRPDEDPQRQGGIYVAEFPIIDRNSLANFSSAMASQLDGSSPMDQLAICADGLYMLTPQVKGLI